MRVLGERPAAAAAAAPAQSLIFTVGRQRDPELVPGCQEDPDALVVPGSQAPCPHKENKRCHVRARDISPPIPDRRHSRGGFSTGVRSVEKLPDGASQLSHILKPFDQVSLEGQDVREVLHQPQLRFLRAQPAGRQV